MLEGERQSRRKQALMNCARDIEHAPPLRRMNGFGVGLYGSLRDPIFPGAYWKMYWISALWIPLIPLRVYLVSPANNGFRFHRAMGLVAFHRIYASRLALLYLSAVGESLLLLMAIAVVLVLVIILLMGLRGIL